MHGADARHLQRAKVLQQPDLLVWADGEEANGGPMRVPNGNLRIINNRQCNTANIGSDDDVNDDANDNADDKRGENDCELAACAYVDERIDRDQHSVVDHDADENCRNHAEQHCRGVVSDSRRVCNRSEVTD